MHRSIAHRMATNEPILNVNADTTLVAEVALTMLLCPSCVQVPLLKAISDAPSIRSESLLALAAQCLLFGCVGTRIKVASTICPPLA